EELECGGHLMKDIIEIMSCIITNSGKVTKSYWGWISGDGPGDLVEIEIRLNANQDIYNAGTFASCLPSTSILRKSMTIVNKFLITFEYLVHTVHMAWRKLISLLA
ncbi:hypothetical protein TSAR_011001, partial [Trichomalopsis sarcophagae]